MAIREIEQATEVPTPARAMPSWQVLLERYDAALMGAIGLLVILGAWELITASGMVDPLFLTRPTAIFATLFTVMMNGEILPHIAESAKEAALGFSFALLVGIPGGIILGRVQRLRQALEPAMMALYSTPSVALLPLLILWFGIGLWSKVFLVFLGAVFVIVVNTEAGVSGADPRLIETARSFTATRFAVMWHVILPSAVPFIVAAIRLAIGRVMIMVVVVEFYASVMGIGWYINRAGSTFNTAKLFAGVILLAATGMFLTQLLRWLEQRIAPWHYARDEG